MPGHRSVPARHGQAGHEQAEHERVVVGTPDEMQDRDRVEHGHGEGVGRISAQAPSQRRDRQGHEPDADHGHEPQERQVDQLVMVRGTGEQSVGLHEQRPVGHGRVQPQVVDQRHRRGRAEDAGAVVVRADVVAHHLALGGVAVDVPAEQRRRQEQRHDPQCQHHHELADRHPLHLRERADQAVPDAHEQHEAAVHGDQPEEVEVVVRRRLAPTAGTPKNHAPGSFKTNGDHCWLAPTVMALTAMNPRMAGRTSRARPVAVHGSGLEVGTDEGAEGPASSHRLVPDRQAVEGPPHCRDRRRIEAAYGCGGPSH